MLSDEEKRELKELINLMYNNHISQYGKRKLEKYIKKQSKEIEELKAISEYREKIIKGLGLKTLPKTITGFRKLIENNDKKWEDKIKAKIEEINKREQDLQNSINDKEREEYSDANISWELMDIHIRKEVLQSLLDKE